MTLKLIAGGTANMSFIMIAECMIVFSAAAVEVVIWSSDVWESIKYLDDDGFEYEGENFEKATTKEVIVNIGKVRCAGRGSQQRRPLFLCPSPPHLAPSSPHHLATITPPPRPSSPSG